MMENQILDYDRDWEEVKQAIMPKEFTEAQKEAMMKTIILKAIITNT